MNKICSSGFLSDLTRRHHHMFAALVFFHPQTYSKHSVGELVSSVCPRVRVCISEEVWRCVFEVDEQFFVA